MQRRRMRATCLRAIWPDRGRIRGISGPLLVAVSPKGRRHAVALPLPLEVHMLVSVLGPP
jgi:hypothetical protein